MKNVFLLILFMSCSCVKKSNHYNYYEFNIWNDICGLSSQSNELKQNIYKKIFGNAWVLQNFEMYNNSNDTQNMLKDSLSMTMLSYKLYGTDTVFKYRISKKNDIIWEIYVSKTHSELIFIKIPNETPNTVAYILDKPDCKQQICDLVADKQFFTLTLLR